MFEAKPSSELARVTHEGIGVLFESPTASHFEMARNGARNDPCQAERRALFRLTADDVRSAMARTRGSISVMGATGDPELVNRGFS